MVIFVSTPFLLYVARFMSGVGSAMAIVVGFINYALLVNNR